jgi:UDP-N-acetylmuramoyl-L-alanine---L-glutamate ligase
MTLTGHIAILGFGREGVSTYSFLMKQWYTDITILDRRALSEFSETERAILQKEKHILGEEYLNTLSNYDTIIKAPGISPYHPQILPYRERITSQTEIFFDNYGGQIIAITGTKGKSTTTSLIYTMLRDAGYSVGIVGNIGNPVLDSLDAGYEYVVFEMSSYMLDGARINPYISVIVNLYREHLDYHAGYENYKRAKFSVIGPDSYLVFPAVLTPELAGYQNISKSFGPEWESHVRDGSFYMGDTPLFPTQKIQLLGAHNLDNISATIAVWLHMGISRESIQVSMEKFVGLPHRLERVTTKEGITFYDDAISTTPESTIAAIRSIEWVDTIFLGGSNRGYDFTNLIDVLIASDIHNLVFFRDTGTLMAGILTERLWSDIDRYATLHTNSMSEAVDFAFAHTRSWWVCLLSCASPSYSLWRNFEAKGDEFRKCIEEYS